LINDWVVVVGCRIIEVGCVFRCDMYRFGEEEVEALGGRDLSYGMQRSTRLMCSRSSAS